MASESFTYSNGALPTVSSGVWLAVTGSSNFNVSSNAALPGTTNTFCANLYGTAASGQTQFSEVVVTFTGTTTPYNERGLVVRGTGASASTFYYAYVSGRGDAEITRVSSGSFTSIAGPLTTEPTTAGSRTYRLEATGSTIRLLRDGTQILSTTDANLTGLYAGIAGFDDPGTQQLTDDNWQGPETSSAPTGTVAVTLGSLTPSASGTVANPPQVAYVKEVGQAANTTSATTVPMTVAAGGVPIGDVVLVLGSADNMGTGGAASSVAVSDSRTNTWTTLSPQAIADPGTTAAGIQGFIAWTKVTTAMVAGDTITVTFGAATAAKAVNAQQFTSTHAGTPILASTYTTQDNNSATNPSVTATATAQGQAVVALVAVEGGTADTFTQDSDTTNGTWVGLTRRGSGTTTSGATLNSAYKIVTASGAQTYNPTLGTARDNASAIVILNVNHQGTAAPALSNLTSTASGTVTNPGVSGTAAPSLGSLTSTASGTFTPPPVTGTVAVTLGSLTPNAFSAAPHPASISGSKILDQHGNVYLWITMSSWAMAMHLTDAQITTELQKIAANGIRGVTVWFGGGYNIGASWDNGSPFSTYATNHGNWWTGTPWQSSLGPGWQSFDWLLSECLRLGLTVSASLGAGNGNTGAGVQWEAATNTQMHDAGVAVATRYPKSSYPHLIWHTMLDDSTTTTSSTRGQRVQNFWDGVNDTEGATARPVRWMEQGENQTTNSSGWLAETTNTKLTVNTWYDYDDNATEIVEATYTEVSSTPVGDAEPPYKGAPHYGGNENQQLRERTWATFIEGGSFINYGHEDWWPFGASGLFTAGLTYDQVQTSVPLVQQSYIPPVVQAYMAVSDWAPLASFVTTGEGTGDTKAAVGSCSTAIIVYFPSSRTTVVDTTLFTGTALVKLRWYDPTAGTYSTIASSEAQTASRSISFPSNHSDSTSDWVLVVTASDDRAGTAAATLGSLTSTASGTFTPQAITGTVAVTLGALTPSASGKQGENAAGGPGLSPLVASASGTSTPPAFTGKIQASVSNVTADLNGTAAGPGTVTGTIASSVQNVTADLNGTMTPPPRTGTIATTVADVTADLNGTRTVPSYTGRITSTLENATADINGTAAGPGVFTGVIGAAVQNVTADLNGTVVSPVSTGRIISTVGDATADINGTSAAPGINTGIIHAVVSDVTVDLNGTTAVPVYTGKIASTLENATADLVGSSLDPGATVPGKLTIEWVF